MLKKASSVLDLDNITPAYLFVGEVDSRRISTLNKLLAAIVEPGTELFGLERFDGDSSSAAVILPAVMGMPFGGSRKVVVVDRVDRLSADDQSKIAAFIPKLGAMSCLIMLSGDENPAKKKAGAAKQSDDDDENSPQQKSKKGLQTVLSGAVKKNGTVLDFPKMKAQDVTTLIAQIVREHGKKIAAPALQMLSYSMQSSPSLIEREVEKLTTYIGERETIAVVDVEEVTTRSPEDRVFPLIDAVAAGRTDTAIHLLSETLAASMKPDNEVPKVLALLGRHFRILYQVKYLVTAGGLRSLNNVPDELREMLLREPSPVSAPDWQKTKLMDQANHFTQEELRRCLKNILVCELAFKGQGKGSSSPRLNLEMLVLKLSQRKALA